MGHKSYIEQSDLPSTGLNDFQKLFPLIKYGNLSEKDKQEVVVIKESIILRNEKGSKMMVCTRSNRDHQSTVGDCSVMLSNDFMIEECHSDNFGKFSYDINDRLHEHIGAFSSNFSPAKTDSSVLVHYKNPINDKKYIFILFEMICRDYPPPMFMKLNTRLEDALIGMQDIKDISVGMTKFNHSPFDVDKTILDLLKPRKIFSNKNKSFVNCEIKPTANALNINLLKVNIFGIG